MRHMGVLVILASLVLLTKSVTANVLSPGDYENFRSLDLKMLSIGDDMSGLVTNQSATHAPDCVIELAFKFDAVQADLHGIGTLVVLAANVTDHADELRVIQQLSLASRRFLEQLKYHRLILNSVMSNCAENDAVAKSHEVSHTWSDAASLVQSIVKKIGASPRSWAVYESPAHGSISYVDTSHPTATHRTRPVQLAAGAECIPRR